jgi:hypothetical protein
MPVDREGLLAAFGGAIAAVRRLEAGGLRTSTGQSALPFLARLGADLVAREGEIAAGKPLDREWAGGVVRWVAEWVPDSELPLIGRLGNIARLGLGG